VKYGFGVLGTTLQCWLQKYGIAHYQLFNPAGRKLLLDYYQPVDMKEAGGGSRKA
jgi:hypothetical protein